MADFVLEPAGVGELTGHDNLLQSEFWARIKSDAGQTPRRFTISSPSGRIKSALSGREFDRAPLLVLYRGLPMGQSFGYVPLGPDVDVRPEHRREFLNWVGQELARAAPDNCVFIRFDLPWRVANPGERQQALAAPFVKSPVDVQVPDTVELDLSPGMDSVLAGMKSKTRYNIRLSERKGVRVREGTREDLDLWYSMAEETAVRDGITLRSSGFFRGLYDAGQADADVSVRLFIAEVEGDAVAAIITSSCGTRCIYHFGASRNSRRNFMPTYALQWRAIRLAHESGCTAYDLLGIPPSDDPEHPMHGLYRVKTGFGGAIVHRAGCWDLPLKQVTYRAFRRIEGARKFYFGTLRKRIVRRS